MRDPNSDLFVVINVLVKGFLKMKPLSALINQPVRFSGDTKILDELARPVYDKPDWFFSPDVYQPRRDPRDVSGLRSLEANLLEHVRDPQNNGKHLLILGGSGTGTTSLVRFLKQDLDREGIPTITTNGLVGKIEDLTASLTKACEQHPRVVLLAEEFALPMSMSDTDPSEELLKLTQAYPGLMIVAESDPRNLQYIDEPALGRFNRFFPPDAALGQRIHVPPPTPEETLNMCAGTFRYAGFTGLTPEAAKTILAKKPVWSPDPRNYLMELANQMKLHWENLNGRPKTSQDEKQSELENIPREVINTVFGVNLTEDEYTPL